MAKVTLDMETFKALASPTRLQVLRCLDERRKTLAEITKELELNKATVHEHLGILVATGLVKKRDDEGRKWIYYELTWQGERLLHPQDTTTFAILLGFSVAAAGGGIAMLGKALQWWWDEQQLAMESEPLGPERMAAPESGTAESADQAEPSGGSNEPSEPSEPQEPSSEPGGEPNQAATASPEPAEDAVQYDDPAGEEAASQGELLDPDGVFAFLLLITSILFAVLAFALRRRR